MSYNSGKSEEGMTTSFPEVLHWSGLPSGKEDNPGSGCNRCWPDKPLPLWKKTPYEGKQVLHLPRTWMPTLETLWRFGKKEDDWAKPTSHQTLVDWISHNLHYHDQEYHHPSGTLQNGKWKDPQNPCLNWQWSNDLMYRQPPSQMDEVATGETPLAHVCLECWQN